MSHKYLVPTHQVDKLRITLSLPANHADQFSRRCSQLFHTELKKLLDRVLSRLDTGVQTLSVTRPLVLDLGEIPAGTFESTFSRQFEGLLERHLERLLAKHHTDYSSDEPILNLAESSSKVTENIEKLEYQLRRTPQLILSNLAQACLDEHEAKQLHRRLPTSTLKQSEFELLSIDPQLALAKLAQACLEYRWANQMHRSFPSSTLKDICQKWVPALGVVGNLSPTTLQLCSAHYCLVRLELDIPELDIPESDYTAYEKHILLEVFKRALNGGENRRFKTNGLLTLWKIKTVREHIKSQLSNHQLTLLNKNMVKELEKLPLISKEKDKQWVSIPNAGLSLLWPFLPHLFQQLGLIKDEAFLNREAKLKAVSCIKWLCQAQGEQGIYSPLTLLMCGMTEEVPLELTTVDEATLAFLENWLEGLPQALQGKWQKLSPGDIQTWFLQRSGYLTTDESPVLTIPSDAVDVLLHDWPWPINIITLPWLEHPIKVVWDSLA